MKNLTGLTERFLFPITFLGVMYLYRDSWEKAPVEIRTPILLLVFGVISLSAQISKLQKEMAEIKENLPKQ